MRNLTSTTRARLCSLSLVSLLIASAASAGTLEGNILTSLGNFSYLGGETLTPMGGGIFEVSGFAFYVGDVPGDVDLTMVAGQIIIPVKTWIAGAVAIEQGLVGTPLTENATGDLGVFGILVAKNGIHSPDGFVGDIDITDWDIAALNALTIDTTQLEIDLTVVPSGRSQSMATGTFTIGAGKDQLVADMTFIYDLAPGDDPFFGTLTANLVFTFESPTEMSWTGVINSNLIPEPASLTLIALSGLIVRRRRRRSRCERATELPNACSVV